MTNQPERAKFPQELYEAEHQETLFRTLFGENKTFMSRTFLNLVPKIVYRSDSTRTLYLLYATEVHVWAVAVDPSKEGPVNATDAWVVPHETGAWDATITTFFKDVTMHINTGKFPADRHPW